MMTGALLEVVLAFPGRNLPAMRCFQSESDLLAMMTSIARKSRLAAWRKKPRSWPSTGHAPQENPARAEPDTWAEQTSLAFGSRHLRFSRGVSADPFGFDGYLKNCLQQRAV